MCESTASTTKRTAASLFQQECRNAFLRMRTHPASLLQASRFDSRSAPCHSAMSESGGPSLLEWGSAQGTLPTAALAMRCLYMRHIQRNHLEQMRHTCRVYQFVLHGKAIIQYYGSRTAKESSLMLQSCRQPCQHSFCSKGTQQALKLAGVPELFSV